jgi:SAM-dependent methyltransferase
MSESYEDLISAGISADVTGWDFSWLAGRATEQRPPWGYARQLGERLASASASLDIQTGGGEVLAEAATFPPIAVATESWPPNVDRAARLLGPHGVVVVADPDEPPLPFADATFDLVTSRHPATVWWDEIARVLGPGGVYFAQHVGPVRSSSSSSSSARSRRQGADVTPTTRSPRQWRQAWRSWIYNRHAYGSRSTTSRRSSTCCAR